MEAAATAIGDGVDPSGESATGDLERAVLAGARCTLDDVALALEGWRLKLADQFDELLCFARTRDVRRLDHQVETVHRVLRTFCGRALLADEVGLGKTIEAGMLILEYLLRGMARTVLIVCPAALVGQWRSELADKFSIDAESTDDPRFRSSPEAAWADGREPQVIVASLQMARSPATQSWFARGAGTSSWSTRRTTSRTARPLATSSSTP